ncbi:MAG: ankyrin repeat domain-containing protein [Bacteroidetes bacterium]|nr:ankyrin repeat domain-containing protein [Bacteroidota bacterium]
MKNVVFIFVLLVLGTSITHSQELINAVRQGNLQEAKSILENDPAKITDAMDGNRTAFHIACDAGNLDIVKFLVENNADIQAKDVDGDTPLHWAAFRGRDEIAAYLLEIGAEINAVNLSQNTPLVYAVNNRRSSTIDLLLNNGAEVNTDPENGGISMISAASSGNVKIVNLLLEKGVGLDFIPLTGGSSLHTAASGGITEIVKKLIEAKADVNGKNLYMLTPLHLASKYGHLETARVLVQNGALIEEESSFGKKAIHYAKESDNSELVKFLIANGADNSDYKFESSGLYMGETPPGLEPKLFAPGIVSTFDHHEFSMAFTPDAKEFYFTRRPATAVGQQRIWFTKIKNDKWIMPQLAPFTYDAFEYEPHISPDGAKLYYGSRRPKPGETENNVHSDIWVMDKTTIGWSEPEYIGTNMMYVSASNNGTIYYTALTDNGSLAKRIWNGTDFEPEEKLGENINFLVGIAHPFIAPDESYLIYDGRVERSAETDLYVSFKTKDGGWTKGVKIGHDVNTDFGEMTASVSPDSKYLFFESSRTGVLSTFWVSMDVIKELKPEEQ